MRTLNQTFAELKVAQHPGKTFIGRIERGFDFLGYYFTRGPLGLAQKALQNHTARLHRLYEQQTRKFQRRPPVLPDASARNRRPQAPLVWMNTGCGGSVGVGQG